jgi:hypothetical protein
MQHLYARRCRAAGNFPSSLTSGIKAQRCACRRHQRNQLSPSSRPLLWQHCFFICVKFESIGEKTKWSIHSTSNTSLLNSQGGRFHKHSALITSPIHVGALVLRSYAIFGKRTICNYYIKAEEVVILCALVLGIFQIIIFFFYISSLLYFMLHWIKTISFFFFSYTASLHS